MRISTRRAALIRKAIKSARRDIEYTEFCQEIDRKHGYPTKPVRVFVTGYRFPPERSLSPFEFGHYIHAYTCIVESLGHTVSRDEPTIYDIHRRRMDTYIKLNVRQVQQQQ